MMHYSENNAEMHYFLQEFIPEKQYQYSFRLAV